MLDLQGKRAHAFVVGAWDVQALGREVNLSFGMESAASTTSFSIRLVSASTAGAIVGASAGGAIAAFMFHAIAHFLFDRDEGEAHVYLADGLELQAYATAGAGRQRSYGFANT